MLSPTHGDQLARIGERVHLQRRRQPDRPSQRELSRRCGFGTNRVNQIENAELPSVGSHELYALAAELSCSVEFLLGLVDVDTPRATLDGAIPGLRNSVTLTGPEDDRSPVLAAA